MTQSCNIVNPPQKFSRTCILLVFGIPATGKSSLVEQLVSRTDLWRDNIQCVHVCTDDFYPPDLRQSILSDGTSTPEQSRTHTSIQFKWKEHRKHINANIEKWLLVNQSAVNDKASCHSDCSASADNNLYWEDFISKTSSRNNNSCLRKINEKDGKFLSDHTVVIVDDNLPLQSMRYEYYQMARKTSSGFCEVFVTCELEQALSWNDQRSHPIPSHTITAMSMTIEPPQPTKYHWEKNSIIVKSDNWWKGGGEWNDLCKKVYHLCEEALKNPVQPIVLDDKIDCRQITKENLVHQVDQKLRDCVSGVMKKCKLDNMPTGSIRQEAVYVNQLRKSILDEFRSDRTLLDQEEVCVSDVLKSAEERFNDLYSNQLLRRT